MIGKFDSIFYLKNSDDDDENVVDDKLKIFNLKLKLLRFLFFLLLAVDINFTYLNIQREIENSYTYFYLTDVDFLFNDNFFGIRLSYSARFFLHKTTVITCLFCAFNLFFNYSCILLTISYFLMYFSTQLDGYQHHYFIFLCLFLLSIFNTKETKNYNESKKYLWIIKLFCIQLSILYFFTAISKIDEPFLSGKLLIRQLSRPWLHILITNIRKNYLYFLFKNDMIMWKIMAFGVVSQELFLAISWFILSFNLINLKDESRRIKKAIFHSVLQYLSIFMIIMLHGAIEIFQFKIGFFSYYMFIISILIILNSLFRFLNKSVIYIYNLKLLYTVLKFILIPTSLFALLIFFLVQKRVDVFSVLINKLLMFF